MDCLLPTPAETPFLSHEMSQTYTQGEMAGQGVKHQLQLRLSLDGLVMLHACQITAFQSESSLEKSTQGVALWAGLASGIKTLSMLF